MGKVVIISGNEFQELLDENQDLTVGLFILLTKQPKFTLEFNHQEYEKYHREYEHLHLHCHRDKSKIKFYLDEPSSDCET